MITWCKAETDMRKTVLSSHFLSEENGDTGRTRDLGSVNSGQLSFYRFADRNGPTFRIDRINSFFNFFHFATSSDRTAEREGGVDRR